MISAATKLELNIVRFLLADDQVQKKNTIRSQEILSGVPTGGIHQRVNAMVIKTFSTASDPQILNPKLLNREANYLRVQSSPDFT